MNHEDFGILLFMFIAIVTLLIGSCQYSKKVDAMVRQYGIELQNRR
jgi:hypothetical protein